MATMSPPADPVKRSRRGSGAVTLHDVARLAGVAPITASRALNTPEQVSPEVLQQGRRRGRAAPATCPTVLAGGLASTRSRLVAAVVPTIAGPVFLQTVQSLTEALAEHGYQLMLGQSGYVDSREDALLEAIIGRRPDGIVLTGIMHSAEGRKRLLAAGIPVVETWDLTPTPIDMLVGFSHADVGRAVADFLHAQGPAPAGRRRRRRRARAAAPCGVQRRRPRRSACPTVPVVVGAGADDAASSGRSALAELLRHDPRDRRGVLQLRPAGAGRDDRGAGARPSRCPRSWRWSASATWSSPPTCNPALTTRAHRRRRHRPPGGALHRRPRRRARAVGRVSSTSASRSSTAKAPDPGNPLAIVSLRDRYG